MYSDFLLPAQFNFIDSIFHSYDQTGDYQIKVVSIYRLPIDKSYLLSKNKIFILNYIIVNNAITVNNTFMFTMYITLLLAFSFEIPNLLSVNILQPLFSIELVATSGGDIY